MATTTAQPIKIASAPGIKRDGTLWEGTNYSDGVWCRFDARQRPKKIGGYSALTNALPEVARGLNAFPSDGVFFVHMGGESFLHQVQVQFNGTTGGETDRTPASGFTPSANNVWQFAQFYNKATGITALCAHPGQNLTDITNTVETPIVFGNVMGTTALAPSSGSTPMPAVAGGVVALPPYLMGYSINGRIDCSAVNDYTTLGGSGFFSETKIIKGLPIRNGGGGPAGIFWSLNQLIIGTFDPSIVTGLPFYFNVVSDDVSPLSSSAMIEFDGIYYWPEIDHFSMYNGIVRELPNNLNIDFFFDNLNYAYRQKVFVFKVPRWGEIWWCFPMGNATECNWAVVYNTRFNTWYDTPLPAGGRTAATSPKVLQYPLMTDAGTDPDAGNAPTLWLHETGTDKVVSGASIPIDSYIHTHEISPMSQGQNKNLHLSVFEPDFVFAQPLTITPYWRPNPNVPQQEGETLTITSGEAVSLDNQLARFKQNARLLSFRIETNQPGGYFRMGEPYAHVSETEARYTL